MFLLFTILNNFFKYFSTYFDTTVPIMKIQKKEKNPMFPSKTRIVPILFFDKSKNLIQII